MNNNHSHSTTDDLLLDFLDGKLEGTGLQSLKQQLEQSPSLKQRLEELRTVHVHLSAGKMETPSSDFVAKVMRNLTVSSFQSALSPRNGMLLIAGILVAAGILAAMLSSGAFDNAAGVISLESVQPTTKYLQYSMPSVPINGKIILDSIIGISLILSLVVLDRTVLRPLFNRRAGAV